MIGEFEHYHGSVLRQLIVGANREIRIAAADDLGRVNSFLVNGRLGIYIKHSSKRLAPWQFTYQDAHLGELVRLQQLCEAVWLVHACGQDGMVALSISEFYQMNPLQKNTTSFVRVDRDRNTMYRVNGTGSTLPKPKKRGLDPILKELGH